MPDKEQFVGEYLEGLKRCLDALPLEQVAALINRLEEARAHSKQVFIIGNGGSSATASHMACDLSKNIAPHGGQDRAQRLRALSLTDNMPWITALANDFGYEHIFSEQLKNLCQPGDLVIAITGSGKSSNVIEAVRVAKELGAVVVGILGFDGGKVLDLVDQYVLVKSDDYGYIEDIHMVIDHVVTSYFKSKNEL